jgi:DNA-nicking Smr family endonuclease
MEDEPVRIEITNELDLHAFQPREVGDLLVDYLNECQKLGILHVRVIHGKGTGTLRSGVHAALSKMPIVESWAWPAAANGGGWGATWVHLRP